MFICIAAIKILTAIKPMATFTLYYNNTVLPVVMKCKYSFWLIICLKGGPSKARFFYAHTSNIILPLQSNFKEDDDNI
jgi:hypothetical protein